MPIRRCSFRCARRPRQSPTRARSPTRTCRSTASRSPSRTTSTSRGCRPPRPVRRLPISPRVTPPRWRGSSAPARSSSARPTSISSRPASSAFARPMASRAIRSIRSSARAARARARRSRSPRASCRSRSAPIRPDRAACRPGSTISSGSSRASVWCRPPASCRPAAASIACRCLRSPPTMRSRRSPRSPGRMTTATRARCRSARPARCRRCCASRCRRPPDASSLATSARRLHSKPRSRLLPRSARASSRSTLRRSWKPRSCSTKGRGSPSAGPRSARSSRPIPMQFIR